MRTQILHALLDTLINHPKVSAFWEAGSVATGRADELSDLDLYVVCKDDAISDVQQQVEMALQSIAPYEIRFPLPMQAWKGIYQFFLRLEGAGPYLLIDLCLIEELAPTKLLEPEMHGKPHVFFDRTGVTQVGPSDAKEMAARIAPRLDMLLKPAELFSPFVQKEVLRGREVDTFFFYQGLLARLVEALRIRYAPWRYNFGLRYLGHDLPPEIYEQVNHLVYSTSHTDLPAKTEQLMSLLRTAIAEVKELDLVEHLETHR